jgi:hypothetical protein
MKPDLGNYLSQVISVVNRLGGDKNDIQLIITVFNDIEMEIGYLDQKRDEAQTNLQVLLLALEKST